MRTIRIFIYAFMIWVLAVLATSCSKEELPTCTPNYDEIARDAFPTFPINYWLYSSRDDDIVTYRHFLTYEKVDVLLYQCQFFKKLQK